MTAPAPQRFTMEDFVVYALGSCAVIAGCGVALAIAIGSISHAVSYSICLARPETPRCVVLAEREVQALQVLP